jgi:hypothetical protein
MINIDLSNEYNTLMIGLISQLKRMMWKSVSMKDMWIWSQFQFGINVEIDVYLDFIVCLLS